MSRERDDLPEIIALKETIRLARQVLINEKQRREKAKGSDIRFRSVEVEE